jgi:hypothetical protein
VAILNLDADIRYKPEYMWFSLIPGAKEPNGEQINHYFRPLIDECLVGWERGIHISPTGKSPSGRDVDLAIIISVNDLPAARKASGSAGVGSNHYCTVCNCFGIQTSDRTDCDHPDWSRRDIDVLRKQAYAWKNAQTQAERDKIFKEHGVRWSEFWRLPYWDPTRMLVIDGMHCVLGGLAHYHCHKVLHIDAEKAKKKERGPVAFEQDWVAYDLGQVPPRYVLVNPEKEERQISSIQARLTAPLALDNEDLVDEPPVNQDDKDQEIPPVPEALLADSELEKLRKAIAKCNLLPIRFVARSLGLSMGGVKADFVQKLITWVSVTNLLLFTPFNDSLNLAPRTTTSWFPAGLDSIRR